MSISKNAKFQKRKVNSNYEFVTMKGNCFVFKTYKDNGYCYDIFRQSNIDGETLTHFLSSYHNESKSIFFMSLNNMEFYLDNSY